MSFGQVPGRRLSVSPMNYHATAEEMARLDKLAIESGLEIQQMMELAGWHVLEVFRDLEIRPGASVVVVCGTGNQAGDGLCAARHLSNNGYHVEAILIKDLKSKDALHHLQLVEQMQIPIHCFSDQNTEHIMYSADIIIDAMIGYNLKNAPRDQFANAIRLINNSKATVIAYDIPTGLDTTTGQIFDPCIRADATLTLGLMKKAFETEAGQKVSGQIFLKDIGIPRFVYDQITAIPLPTQ